MHSSLICPRVPESAHVCKFQLVLINYKDVHVLHRSRGQFFGHRDTTVLQNDVHEREAVKRGLVLISRRR